LTKQLCGLGVLRRPSVIETNKSRLVGKHLGETENSTRELLETRWAVRCSSMRCTTFTTRGIKGDPFGTAVIETLLPYMENHRDDLVVFGAGYPKAMQRMLSANQGLRRRFSTTIVFESYTPDELWRLTQLIAGHDEDMVAPETQEVLRPVFTRYYNEQSQTLAGEIIRGVDWLGSGGFVRNLIEKARDHRNNRLDTVELDELLAADSFDATDENLMTRFRTLIPEDFAEGLQVAVAEAERNRDTDAPE
jgi:hypothetical protein